MVVFGAKCRREGKGEGQKGRQEFRAALKAKKYADKEIVEYEAFGDGKEAGVWVF